MLLQFKFKNHKCFYDETILDLMATQEKRHLESTINVNGNNILPIIAIHGANASGKSSALETLDFMFNFVKYSNRMDINNDLPTIPFAFKNGFIQRSLLQILKQVKKLFLKELIIKFYLVNHIQNIKKLGIYLERK